MNGTRFGDWILYGNIHIGLAAASYVAVSFFWWQLPVNGWLCLAAFFGAFVAYRIDHDMTSRAADVINRPRRVAFCTVNRRVLRSLTVLSTFGFVVSVSFLEFLAAAVSITAVFFYGAYYFLTRSNDYSRRLSGRIKPILIVVGWILGAVWIPLIIAGKPIEVADLLLTGTRMAYLVPNVLWFEQFDITGDTAEGKVPWDRLDNLRYVRYLTAVVASAGAILPIIAVWHCGAPELVLLESVGLVAGAVGMVFCRPASWSLWSLDVWLLSPATILLCSQFVS